MMTNFRTRLRAGELLVGPMVTLGSPEVCEILVEAGYDWLFLDAEHTTIAPSHVQAMLQAVPTTPCLVRVPSSEPTFITKVLDAGAAGIIVPQVNSVQQARDVVQAARYAPAGSRGRGLARAHRYGFKLSEYAASANETVTVIVQAEHRDAIAAIDDIVRVDGIDGVLIGPYDLSSSYGRPGEVDHPEIVGAIERVRAACAAVDLPTGMFGLSADAVRPYIPKGFTFLVAGIDVLMLGQAASTIVKAVRT